MQKLLYLFRWTFLRDELDRILFLSLVYCAALPVVATAYTGHMVYFFLGWNLFLALIPYILTHLPERTGLRSASFIPLLLWFGAWLLFIPNSFYILTDLYHLGEMAHVPGWFDLLVLLSYAWVALVLGIVSVRQMEKALASRWRFISGPVFVYPVMFLNAWGVYLGRYLRFNSWDVVTSPFSLIQDITNLLLHPVAHRYAWGMVIGFSVFMTLVYEMLKRLSRMLNGE